MAILTDRQKQLYEILQTRQRISTEEIRTRFCISSATASRDIHALVQAGVAAKVSYGIKLVASDDLPLHSRRCFSCGKPLQERTLFSLQMKNGLQRSACCCACGLAALDQPEVESARAADFISGRMVDVGQATYVRGSRVSLCCEPSVLCFADEDKARGFQTGFGGSLETFDSVLDHLRRSIKESRKDPNTKETKIHAGGDRKRKSKND